MCTFIFIGVVKLLIKSEDQTVMIGSIIKDSLNIRLA
jgi:hypothetical protein